MATVLELTDESGQPIGGKLHDAQIIANKMLGGTVPHVMLFGGARSGKTFLIVRRIISRALQASGSRHLIARFRFNSVNASVINDTFPKVLATCFPGVEGKLNKSDWFYEFGNGSQIWFAGLDDKERTEKILGMEFATIFLNECSQIPKGSRDIVVTRLAQVAYLDADPERMLPLKMFYDENPPTKGHWTHKMFVEKKDPETKKHYEPDQAARFTAMQINPESNAENLPASFFDEMRGLSQRLQRRFLRGEFADDNPDALFREELIDRWRVVDGEPLPDFVRIVVAVDPSGASGKEDETNDAIGIVVGGLGANGIGYILEDLTGQYSPGVWGKIVANAVARYDADMVVGEANFGGDMVRHVVQSAAPAGKRIPYKAVTASRGKVVRAEPVSSLYEDGRVRHAGIFMNLEDELTGFSTKGYMGEGSPNRADAAIWLCAELFPGIIAPRKSGSGPPRPDLDRPNNWSA